MEQIILDAKDVKRTADLPKDELSGLEEAAKNGGWEKVNIIAVIPNPYDRGYLTYAGNPEQYVAEKHNKHLCAFVMQNDADLLLMQRAYPKVDWPGENLGQITAYIAAWAEIRKH